MEHALWPSDAVHADVTLESKGANGEGLDMQMKLVRDQRAANVRTQLRIVEPPGATGSVYEITSQPGKPLDREMYISALRRIRDVSGIRRTDAFMGSEFSYEDLDIAAPRDSEWKHVERVEQDGRPLVRVTSAPYSQYERVEVLLDPKTALPVSVSFYDRDGSLYKLETFSGLETVDGHELPTRIEMQDVQNGAKSVLRLHGIRLRDAVDEKVFSESPLRTAPVGAKP